jgi:hypothetical protein
VSKIKELKGKILREAHESAYSIHPGGNKMYHDLKANYWWYGMKRDVAGYVALCDTCQRVKAEHQPPTGLLQSLQVPEWKLEEMTMDFIVGLPRTQSGYDSIWVIVDRLTKVAQFIPVKTTYSEAQLAELYMLRILEDMLRACALQCGRSWDKSLPYVEFSYNNSYQESLKMAPFEMLYGQLCRTPLFWNETRERKVFRPNILEEAEKQVRMVRKNLRVAQSRQKSCADHRRRELSFEVGDFFLPQGVTYERVASFQGSRQARTKIHWTI